MVIEAAPSSKANTRGKYSGANRLCASSALRSKKLRLKLSGQLSPTQRKYGTACLINTWPLGPPKRKIMLTLPSPISSTVQPSGAPPICARMSAMFSGLSDPNDANVLDDTSRAEHAPKCRVERGESRRAGTGVTPEVFGPQGNT